MILATFAAIYLIPPFLVLRRLPWHINRTTLFLASAGLGLSSQALLGFFWNHVIKQSPALEGMVYFLLWLVIGLVSYGWKRKTPPLARPTAPTLILPLILLAAIILRSFDALGHASLGQSDAYTHLQFLRDVIQHGQIRNIVYPPGYSWVLALPVMTFHLDAYMVARYVGPFFAVLLITTLYQLGRLHSQTAGLYAAFFAAICPLFYPLIKTGMGAFANQMGLVLLPLALFLYLIEARFLFAIILLGLTVSVPLFVFTLALIIGLHRIFSYHGITYSGADASITSLTTESEESAATNPARRRRNWWRKSILLLLPFGLAFALASYHFLTTGTNHVAATATIVTGIKAPASLPHSPNTPPPSILTTLKSYPAGILAIDLLTAKRWGLGSVLMNLASLTLAGMFTGILIAGFRKSSGILKLMGSWGLLTTLQATTGILEFSMYQRSGWILMEAIALAGGIILAWLHGMEKLWKVIRPLVVIALTASVLIAFWAPPQHRCITSGAEDELVTVLRELSAAKLDARHTPSPLSFERWTPSPLISRAAVTPHLAVVTRRYTLFNADQGNLANVIPDPTANIPQIPVEVDSHLKPPCDQFVCLIDRSSGLPDMGLLARISPQLTDSITGYQAILYQPNDVILAFLKALPPETWQITQEDRGTNLSVYLVERLRP